MSAPVATYVYANDPILQAGVIAQLRLRPEISVMDAAELDQAQVAVVVVDALDAEILRVLRAMRRGPEPRTVLVARVIDDRTVVAGAEAGVAGLLRRVDATPDVLIRTIIRVAHGHGEIPADMLGRLLGEVGRLQRQARSPRGPVFTGLSEREAQVLRLIADGSDTAEIAKELCYSERTVKNVLHDVTTRLQLKNRAHAVAYAVREGLI